MDETGVMLSMLGSVKVLVGKDGRRNYRGAGVKRTMVTAIECVSDDDRALLPLIIWPASTHRSNWTTYETPGWHYAHSENGYNDSKISLEWLTRVFDPQTKAPANGKPRLLVCDGFGSHETLEILEFCLTNNIILCRLLSHTSYKLQLCDVGPFAPLKTAYRDQVERLNRGVDVVGKEHFTYLYSPARERALTQRNIRAGWSATGLYPFNSDIVLKDVPKPLGAAITSTSTSDVMLQSPITLVTLVTAEALTLLHNMIEQDTNVPDKTRSRIQKLANAAQMSFAERALLKDRNRFLFKINNEAKARRSTRSIVLGKAKVMSFEDLEEARAKRAARDEAAERKEQRGRKRKGPALEADVVHTAKTVRVNQVLAPMNASAP